MLPEPNSPDGSPERPASVPSLRKRDIPLQDFLLRDGTEFDDENSYNLPPLKRPRPTLEEAEKLVRRHTRVHGALPVKPFQVDSGSGLRSGTSTPTEQHKFTEDYRPRPQYYRGGILGSLLKLYTEPQQSRDRSPTGNLRTAQHRPFGGDCSITSTPQQSPPDSGASSPTGGKYPWYHLGKSQDHAASSLTELIGTSNGSIGARGVSGFSEEVNQRLRRHQEQAKSSALGKRGRPRGGTLFNRFGKLRKEEQYRITNHIAETIIRQKYLINLCKALMQYGAPTHRLEEYLRMSARVLETNAQFLYIPGSMIVSFEDQDTHTSEVKLVKVDQGLDLGKLSDVHEIYKEVVSHVPENL